MALVPMKNLLDNAVSKNIAVGAFNVGNMEMVMGAVAAAEESGTPIILQISENRLKNSPLELIGPMIISAAKNSKVDIAVQLDCAQKTDTVQKALGMGFSSIMFDGSALPLEENIQMTKTIRKMAAEYGASVEAKLGTFKKNEDGFVTICATPDDAKLFCDETGVDALRVVVGNISEDNSELIGIRYDILDDIHKMVEIPLSLNGVAYLSAETIQQSVMLGIRKVNVVDDNFRRLADAASEYCKTREAVDCFELSSAMALGVYENVKKYIKIFNMQSEA